MNRTAHKDVRRIYKAVMAALIFGGACSYAVNVMQRTIDLPSATSASDTDAFTVPMPRQ